MNDSKINTGRRKVLRMAAGSLAAASVVGLNIRQRAEAADLPHLAEDDPQAVALKYVHDATQAERPEKGGTPGDQQLCSNCQFLQAGEGEWRGCALFPGKGVNVNGWCSAWAPKIS